MDEATLKQTIRDAFGKVVKGDGIGPREAMAEDDYAGEEERVKARAQDENEAWWEIPEPLRAALGTTLSFTDREGFVFLLPAVMTADVDGVNEMDNSVFFHLCLIKQGTQYETSPHHGHPEYLTFLKSIEARTTSDHFGFSSSQLCAIAHYFVWMMEGAGLAPQSLLLADRDEAVAAIKNGHEATLEAVSRDHYCLTLQDAIAIHDEECRIVGEWLALGGVQVSQAKN